MQSHENLIYAAAHDNWLTALAFLYFAKSRYRNSCFYNHSLRKTAYKLGVSHNKLRNYLLILEEKKLIRYHHGNLIFVGQKEIRKQWGFTKNDKYLCTLKIKSLSLKQIRHSLRRKLLERDIAQQQYWINKKAENALLDKVNYSATVKQIKFREKNRTALEKPINYTVTFTDKTLSERFNCSTSTVNEFKKANSDIVVKRKPEKLFRMSFEQYYLTQDLLKDNHGAVYFWRGNVYKALPTEYKNLVRHQ